MFAASAIISDPDWRNAVSAIIQVERIAQNFQPATGLWKRSSEISYYLSNRPIDACFAAAALIKSTALL